MSSGTDMVIQLIETTCVFLVLAYVLTRTRLHAYLGQQKNTMKSAAALIGIFSVFSLYGAFGTISIAGGFADTRTIGSMSAGLLAGPWVGLGSGVTGAVHRYLAGGFTVVSGTLYALLAGVAGGLFYQWRKGKPITPGQAAAVTVAYEVFAACLTLALAPDFAKALQLVKQGFLAMTISKSIGVSLFIFMINNFRIEQVTKEEKEKIEGELQVARDIQMSIVPKVFPPFPNHPEFDLYAVLEPAKAVGGDFYDFFFIDDERICLLIGDVSGKGVPASLFMAVSLTLIRATGSKNKEPDELLASVNNELCRGNDTAMFATVFCGILHTPSGKLVYANGGHNAPYVWQADGSVYAVPHAAGIALGVMEDMPYGKKELQLNPGDTLVLFTDGINEAMNSQYEQFGNDRLVGAIQNSPARYPQRIAETVLADVKRHAAGAEQSDDITLLAVCYTGQTRNQ